MYENFPVKNNMTANGSDERVVSPAIVTTLQQSLKTKNAKFCSFTKDESGDVPPFAWQFVAASCCYFSNSHFFRTSSPVGIVQSSSRKSISNTRRVSTAPLLLHL